MAEYIRFAASSFTAVFNRNFSRDEEGFYESDVERRRSDSDDNLFRITAQDFSFDVENISFCVNIINFKSRPRTFNDSFIL